MIPRLAIEVLRGALAKLLNEFRAFAIMSALPYAVLLGLRFVPVADIAVVYTTLFGAWLAYTYLAVSVHRYVILGSKAVPFYGTGRFGLRELRYLIFWVVAALGVAAVMGMVAIALAPFPYLAGWLMPIAITLSILVLSRFCLVFPAAAVDRDVKLMQSFKITRLHWLSVIVVVCLIPIALFVPNLASGMAAPLIVGPLIAAVSVLAFAWAVIALSYLYQAMTRRYRGL